MDQQPKLNEVLPPNFVPAYGYSLYFRNDIIVSRCCIRWPDAANLYGFFVVGVYVRFPIYVQGVVNLQNNIRSTSTTDRYVVHLRYSMLQLLWISLGPIQNIQQVPA